jgi:hypothetical protein
MFAQRNAIAQERSAVYNANDSSIARVAKWLAKCRSAHDAKSHAMQDHTKTMNLTPIRLLKLDQVCSKGLVYLISSQPLNADMPYATLSHTWGGQCKSRLLFGNEQDFMLGVRQYSLAKTFRNAITFCLRLDISYLWIDALG